MQTRQLGNSDLQITAIGYGAWAIGGAGWEAAWGAQDDNEAIGAIQTAIDAGINWIDTAAVYGLGHSEELVAKALKGRGKRPYIFTKSSKLWDKDRKVISSMKSIRKEIEDSLGRLQTDVVDLYQIHWPNPDNEIEEGWAAMAKLKEEGKVRWIGVSNFNVAQMERAVKIAPITSLQPPYSLVDRKVEAEILPYCEGLLPLTIAGKKLWRSTNVFTFAIFVGVLAWFVQGLGEFSLFIPALAWTAFTLLGVLLGEQRIEFDIKSKKH